MVSLYVNVHRPTPKYDKPTQFARKRIFFATGPIHPAWRTATTHGRTRDTSRRAFFSTIYARDRTARTKGVHPTARLSTT